MPKKSIREMNYLERLHYSLSSKIFHAILIFSIILSLFAIGFGFYLYSSSINDQSSVNANNLAKTVTLAFKQQNGTAYIDEVLRIYERLNAVELKNKDKPAYNDLFSSVVDDNYKELRSLLHSIEKQNNALLTYVAAFDKENNRLVYIIDSSGNSFSRPGYWKEVNERVYSKFKDEPTENLIRSYMPHVIERDTEHGYRCTSWDILRENDRYIILSMADMDMNKYAERGRTFFWQYLALLALITLIIDIFIVLHMKRTIVTPITKINQAARDYMQDKGNGLLQDSHFRSLDIHTGDEIESLALIMGDMEKDIGDYVENLTNVTREKERMGAELNIASQIQDGMLPSIFPAFPERKEFDIYATMTPAKEVGGDFYDFFLIDDDHLAMVIADVSGKGIPAALFMMASKILINNFSMIGLMDPAQILELVNDRICDNNPAEMFVTVWLGILEISTGTLRAANAGHEYPCVYHNNEKSFELFKDRHGLVIGGMKGSKYRSYEMQLKPGDGLFVYTDGVAEATNIENQLFGTDRLLLTLNSHPDANCIDILKEVKDSLDGFVQEAPQFDDITMLAMRYSGPKEKEVDKMEITLDAKVENVQQVTAFIDEELEKIDCPLKAQTQIDVAVDELFSNIAMYAYAPSIGTATVQLEIEDDPRAVVITFIDQGKPYNPLEKEDPDVTLSAEDRQIGGLGIYLVKKTMDDMTYRYEDGKNIVSIKKMI